MNAADKSLRAGELAQLAGVSSDTLRHYERLGILAKAPRTVAGYRKYPAAAIERVRLVRRALQLGFTLAELSEILRVRDNGGAPCRRVLQMTEEKLRLLERQISDLRRTQNYMRQLVREWRRKLIGAGPGEKAHLLQSLRDESAFSPKSAFTSRRRKKL